MLVKRVGLLLLATVSPPAVLGSHGGETCESGRDYPDNPPGAGERHCILYEDCNGNGAYDIDEPCRDGRRAPPAPVIGASVMQDPHIDLAHDGHADFRGKHGSLYNYISTPGLSVNVLFEEALYTLHDGKLLVNGTYMTEVHVTTLVEGESMCKWAYVSYVASELNGQNWGWSNVKVSCGGNEFALGPNVKRACGGLHTSVKMSTANITVAPFEGSTEAAPWKIVVHGDSVHDRIAGPEHRVDIELSYSPQTSAPLIAHGLIGQSFADPLPRIGRLDVYPNEGTFTTTAQAEGAIEGTAEMYEVKSPFETDFGFSLFAGESSHKGTAEAAKATCDKKVADELDGLNRQGKLMAIRPWWKELTRFIQREAAPPSIVARAASIEVQPGEGLLEAHRRLAEPASSRAG